MATELESLMDKVFRMAEKSQERNASNYAQAREDRLYSDNVNRGLDINKQRDVMTNAREGRENAITLANMQGIRDEGLNQRYLDAARIRRGDPVNAEGDIYGNYYDTDGGLAGMGGSGTLRSRASGKTPLTPEQARVAMYQHIRGGAGGADYTAEKAREEYDKLTAANPGVGVASALKDAPGLVRAKIDPISGAPLRNQVIPPGQFAPGERTRENTIPVPGAREPASLNNLRPTLQQQPGIETPYGNAPGELSPAQWKAYADSRAVGRPDRAMTYEGNQSGMVGDQIVRFRRPDGTAFFANTGAARMQAGSAGIQPGPNLEAMRATRSGVGDPAFNRDIEGETRRETLKMNRFGKATPEPAGDPRGPFDIAGRAIVKGMDALSNMVSPDQPRQGPPMTLGLNPVPGFIKDLSSTQLPPLTTNMGGGNLPLSAQGVPPQFGEYGTLPAIDQPTWAQDYNDLSSGNMPRRRMDFPWNTSASLPGFDEEAIRSKRKKARRSASY